MSNDNSQANYLKVGSDPQFKILNWDGEKFKVDSQVQGTSLDSQIDNDDTPKKLRKIIEPWLTALFQSERLNLLVGSGLTIAQGKIPEENSLGQNANFMGELEFNVCSDVIKQASKKIAEQNGRKKVNVEDQINVANSLLRGLQIYAEGNNTNKDLKDKIEKFEKNINENLKSFIKRVLSVEKNILKREENVKKYLIPFLMSFASRSSSRERLHIFTTNYDRVVEWGADLTGLRLIDRFVGNINPIFRASRLNIDIHYNPPGIRGEPRYLEGVAYFTKLHGSLDWHYKSQNVQKIALPFGEDQYNLSPESQCLIYPNSAKDRQTVDYPYAELFRDFATAVCRPNTTLVTYGYGFGDEHINRIIEDMLTIPSTHLVILSYDDPNEKILSHYLEKNPRKEQVSVLMGPQLGDLKNLVDYYLPKSAIDQTMNRMFEIQEGGNMMGCDRLGYLEEGQGNIEVARDAYKKACEGGDMLSCTGLGILELEQGNIKAARKYLKKACYRGDIQACELLGLSIKILDRKSKSD